ncbi:hypothetical protein Sps_04838 [Shewanella psychrophila]|uniref:Prepilin-type N-terminal cleavage/methylation domain-containing protein n=1 Tax=Shewanella psychrophila TaxID=225848 RepID=A0A1S6HWI0_9GAMM|nr:type II secretion system protein [Shewanella psychrophila]AQS39920.1 hypothetical protein Sps_04838 [Shewanella psychrophila]
MFCNTNRKYRGHKKARGLALLEILIAIGILGLIAAGVATLAARTFEKQDLKDIQTDMTDVSIALQQVYSRAAQYVDTKSKSVQEFADSKAIDSSVSINPLTNSAYLFSVAKVRTTDTLNTGFVLGIDNANQTACNALITGPLLDDADYITVMETGTTIADQAFDTSGTIDIKNTTSGINQDIYDPTAVLALCPSTTDQNLIVIGYK